MPLGPVLYLDANDTELSNGIRHATAKLARLAERFGEGPRTRDALAEIEDVVDLIADLAALEEGRRDAATARDDAA